LAAVTDEQREEKIIEGCQVRTLLKCGNFLSLDDLRDQVLAFITYYNGTMAKRIKWTYTGIS
jgi:hypothetical protein